MLEGDIDLLVLEAEDLVDIGPRARQQRAGVASEAGYAIVNATPVLRCAWGNMSPEAFFGDSLYRERRIELGCFDLGEMSVVVTSRTRLDEKEAEGAGPDSSKTIHLVYAVNRGMSGSTQRFEYELRKRDGEWVVLRERLLEALD